MPITLLIGILIWILVATHLLLELRQRDIHLRWIDERDQEFIQMFESAWNLTLIPKDNPVAPFKVGGILSKNALDPRVVSMLDERLESLGGALNAVARRAKSLRTWEMTHSAPPLHYWQAWAHAWKYRHDEPGGGRLSERDPREQTTGKYDFLNEPPLDPAQIGQRREIER